MLQVATAHHLATSSQSQRLCGSEDIGLHSNQSSTKVSSNSLWSNHSNLIHKPQLNLCLYSGFSESNTANNSNEQGEEK